MKTAISVPDATFERVERLVKMHGLKRSQFYAQAAERYAEELESADLTAAIDAAVDLVAEDPSTQFAVSAGGRLLGDEEW